MLRGFRFPQKLDCRRRNANTLILRRLSYSSVKDIMYPLGDESNTHALKFKWISMPLEGTRCVSTRYQYNQLSSASPIALDGLHKDEIEYPGKKNFSEQRTHDFWYGRLLLRRCFQELNAPLPNAILHNDEGGPLLPSGLMGSISHKDGLVVAIAKLQNMPQEFIGIDIEYKTRKIANRFLERILSPVEQERCLKGSRNLGMTIEEYTLLTFSIKEATYKAISPIVKRYVRFHEVAVEPLSDHSAVITLKLDENRTFDVNAFWMEYFQGENTYFISVVTCVGDGKLNS